LQLQAAQTATTVLVVEDDENILNLLNAYLESAGYRVSSAADGESGLQTTREQRFDICVLDVMLPGRSGVELAASMREAGCDTPVLFLTALGNESDVLRGFGAGADDYMVKPFSPRELLVRIDAILRRQRSGPPGQHQQLKFGPITLDCDQPNCLIDGKSLDLTPYEYRILRHLVMSPGRVFGRRALIASLYGNEDAVTPKAIDVHVHHLRAKLGDETGTLIQTVRGFGYTFSPTQTTAHSSDITHSPA